MGVSICIASGKGGVGKTVIAANLGVALSQLGRDVAVVDADIEMGNLELHFGLEGTKTVLHDVLAGNARVEDAVYRGPANLKVVPAGISLGGLVMADPDLLEEAIRELHETSDILLIDSPPGLEKCATIALKAAQEVMLIVNPEISSISDALKTKILAKSLGSRVRGIVLNRVSPASISSRAQEVEIERVFEAKILGVIPEDPEMRRSLAFGEPVVLRRPGSPSSRAIKKLARALVGEDVAEEETPSRKRTKGLFGKI
jgi:septum site-determining protein MinD